MIVVDAMVPPPDGLVRVYELVTVQLPVASEDAVKVMATFPICPLLAGSQTQLMVEVAVFTPGVQAPGTVSLVHCRSAVPVLPPLGVSVICT